MTKIETIREDTYCDLLKKLHQYHKCSLIRPTGFGKTWMLTKLIQEPEFKNILYLYPIQVIKNTVIERYYDDISAEDASIDEETIQTADALKTIPNVTLMTYNKLARLSIKEINSLKFDLIIFDEVHRLGAEKSKLNVSRLIACNKNAYFVGATATPNRMDGFDVINVFFNDISVFDYNAHDAFKDGLLKRPYYCYCTYDIQGDIKNTEKELNEPAFTAGITDVETSMSEMIFKKHVIEASKLYNMQTVIKETCDECLADTSYMKFIIFFSSTRNLNSKKDTVREWYQTAFPNHKIRPLVIISETQTLADNINKLSELKHDTNTIDLIFCIDMLNMGYHVNDLSGIMMYRGTSSDIIYIQQLGRALSSGAENPCIVFDVVDNLHRKAVFDLQTKANKIASKQKNTVSSIGYHVNSNGQIVDKDDAESPFVLQSDGSVTDLLGNKTNLMLSEQNIVIEKPDYNTPDWKTNSNAILPEDLVATRHEATYRELIAKLVAEPMHQRCKMAINAHFRRWCERKGYPYPISDEQLKDLYGISKHDFKNDFIEILRTNHLDYPLQDAAKLLAIGENDGIPPLRIFARIRNVSIAQILDLLEITE